MYNPIFLIVSFDELSADLAASKRSDFFSSTIFLNDSIFFDAHSLNEFIPSDNSEATLLYISTIVVFAFSKNSPPFSLAFLYISPTSFDMVAYISLHASNSLPGADLIAATALLVTSETLFTRSLPISTAFLPSSTPLL